MSIRNNLFDDLMVTKSVFCYNCLYSMDMYLHYSYHFIYYWFLCFIVLPLLVGPILCLASVPTDNVIKNAR